MAPGTLLRSRLVRRLRERFDHRLTVVVAGAGFGKSTLLAQADREARIEGLGVDRVLGLTEADEDPIQLLARLGALLGIDGGDMSVRRIVDAVWAHAPLPVAVVLDDVHRLADDAPAWISIRELLERLPANGHLVLSGRTEPPFSVARLTSQHEVLRVGEEELAFDDDELAGVVELLAIPTALAADLPRWPALTTLVSTVGRDASMDFVWDEVLAAIPEHRRLLLAAAVPFGTIDDDLVGALGASTTAAALVEGVPLVDALDGGAFRLHDLWIGALAGVLDRERRADALRAGATMLLARDELGRAADAFALAGDEAGLRDVLVVLARRPTIAADIAEVSRVQRRLPRSMRDRAGDRYLEALRHFGTDERRAASLFEAAAAAAVAEGDVELELLARWRVVQVEDLDRSTGPRLAARVVELADGGVPLARAIRAFVEARRCQRAGDPRAAVAAMDGLDGFALDQREVSLALLLVDLGRPEALNVTLDDVLASGISDVYAAQAVWLVGLMDPELAWPVARELPARAPGLPRATATSLRSVVVMVGVAAGAHEDVVAISESNVREARGSMRVNEHFARVAAALVELVTVDEATAVATLRSLVAEIPLGQWPERPYLYALCVLRALLPEGEVLDGCDLGPSMRVGVEAGAALAALRRGDPRPAAALPWRSPTLLRVHVPPPLLAELSLAAGRAPGADEVLGSLPHLRTWLRRIVDREAERPSLPRGLADRAATVARTLPARPTYDLRIDLLGGMDVRRSDGVAVEGWQRRERVRNLLAFLALRRDVARGEVAATLWPDMAPEKAANNLRVNLHHLQLALQPDRADEPPWFVQADAARLRLVGDGVTVDAEVVDVAMAAAVRAEAAGIPSEALGHYEQVVAVALEDLLPDLHADWVVYERLRLRSVAHAAAARQGELVLARGEPEAALAVAARAQVLDPLSERAHRLAIRCHLALGSTSTARQAAAQARATIADAGLVPERETMALLDRLGV